MLLTTLSGQLTIVALVGHYPTNKLMVVGPIGKRIAAFVTGSEEPVTTCGISPSFERLFPTFRQVTQLVLTRSPLTYCYARPTCMPNPRRQRSF